MNFNLLLHDISGKNNFINRFLALNGTALMLQKLQHLIYICNIPFFSYSFFLLYYFTLNIPYTNFFR